MALSVNQGAPFGEILRRDDPDPLGYYRDARRSMEEKRTIAEHQDDDAFNERSHHASHLKSPVRFESRLPYDQESEYYHHGLQLPQHEQRLQPWPYPGRDSEIHQHPYSRRSQSVFAPVFIKMENGLSPQAYNSPTPSGPEYFNGNYSIGNSLYNDGSEFMPSNESTNAWHDDGRDSRGQVHRSMAEPAIYYRERYAPSPDTTRCYRVFEDFAQYSDGMNGSRSEEYQMSEGMNESASSDRMSHRHDNEHDPYTPENNRAIQYLPDDRQYPATVPRVSRMSHTAPSTYQIHSLSDTTEHVDHGDFLDGDPERMMDHLRRPRPIRGGSASQTPTYDRDSMSAGSETVKEESTPHRSTRTDRRPGIWPANVVPKTVPREEVSDAFLLKQGIRTTKSGRVCKKSAGANDPINMEIINLKDQFNLRWGEIAQVMNGKVVAKGGEPKYTTDAVTGRYCRNAPVLYSAAGMEFIPLSLRKFKGRAAIPRITWTPQSDVELVKISKNYESAKWTTVARELTEKTGIEVDPLEAARRYRAIKR